MLPNQIKWQETLVHGKTRKVGGLTISVEGCSQRGITKKGCIQEKNQIAIKLK